MNYLLNLLLSGYRLAALAGQRPDGICCVHVRHNGVDSTVAMYPLHATWLVK